MTENTTSPPLLSCPPGQCSPRTDSSKNVGDTDISLNSFLLKAPQNRVMEKLKAVFGKKKPLKEVLRENKRTITRAVRDIDREKSNLEKQEKKLVGEIKKNAKAGQMGAVKVRTGGTRQTSYSLVSTST